MKAKVLFLGLVLTTILFLDYVLVTMIGCVAEACNATDTFYCKVFCNGVISLVIISSLAPFIIAVYKTYYKKR